MAKQSVTHTCGHTSSVTGYNRRDADSKADWAEGRPCSDCARDDARESHRTANEEAAEVNAAAGLPALTGSDKQIAWAESVRAGLIAKAETQITEWGERMVMTLATIGVSPDDPRIAVALKARRDVLAQQSQRTSASWWIDNRSGLPHSQSYEDEMRALFAPEIAREAAQANAKQQEQADQAAGERARHEAELLAARERERAETQADNDRSESACSNFVPLRVTRAGPRDDDLIIYGEMGHVAKGYIEDGETYVIYQIDDLPIRSLLPEAVRLGARLQSLAGVA